jgi:hypothetical protein
MLWISTNRNREDNNTRIEDENFVFPFKMSNGQSNGEGPTPTREEEIPTELRTRLISSERRFDRMGGAGQQSPGRKARKDG